MPLIADAACDTDLSARITGPIDLTLLYSHIKRIRTHLSNTPNTHPIPSGQRLTDHMMRNMDELTITGTLGCMGCTQAVASDQIIATLKQAHSVLIYDVSQLFTITTNRAKYNKMILVDSEIVEQDTALQTVVITTKWVSANIGGEIENPSFQAGGISA